MCQNKSPRCAGYWGFDMTEIEAIAVGVLSGLSLFSMGVLILGVAIFAYEERRKAALPEMHKVIRYEFEDDDPKKQVIAAVAYEVPIRKG